MFDGSDFPKQGRKSAGVARQYCGRLGKVANCQGGMFLEATSARWAGRWWNKRLYLPKTVGPPTSLTGVLRRVCRRTGGTTGIKDGVGSPQYLDRCCKSGRKAIGRVSRYAKQTQSGLIRHGSVCNTFQ